MKLVAGPYVVTLITFLVQNCVIKIMSRLPYLLLAPRVGLWVGHRGRLHRVKLTSRGSVGVTLIT